MKRSVNITRPAQFGGTPCVTFLLVQWTVLLRSECPVKFRVHKVARQRAFGGIPCPPLVEYQQCNTAPCATDCKVAHIFHMLVLCNC